MLLLTLCTGRYVASIIPFFRTCFNFFLSSFFSIFSCVTHSCPSSTPAVTRESSCAHPNAPCPTTTAHTACWRFSSTKSCSVSMLASLRVLKVFYRWVQHLSWCTEQFQRMRFCCCRCFQKALQSKLGKAVNILQTLSPLDLTAAWIGFAHLTEFKTLPAHHFDPAISKPWKIVCKVILSTQFKIPFFCLLNLALFYLQEIRPLSWPANLEPKKNVDPLRNILNEAISSCEKCNAECHSNSLLEDMLTPLYLSLVNLMKHVNK